MKWDNHIKVTVLSAAIRWWMHTYYQKEPVIEDNSFDVFYKELQNLERTEKHVRHDSPTRYPGK